jgi:hypothetical protein
MKYCYACGHTTGGDPYFCNFCGRSYDVKLCPKLHVNPKIAQVCSRCGRRDLSIPQPKVPLSWQLLALLARILSGLLLLFLSFPVVLQFGIAFLTRSDIYKPLLILALLLVPSWFLWAMLPTFLRRIIHRALTSGNDNKR